MDVSIFGQVRGATAPNLGQSIQEQLQTDNRGNLMVAQGLPSKASLVAMGESWSKLSDAVACVTALPTTTAAHTLWNGEPQGGKSLIVDSLAWVCTTSAAAASMFAMMVQIAHALQTTQPATADSATAINSLSGKNAYAGRAKSSHTVTVADNGWMSVGSKIETALSATVGAQIDVPIDGLLVVPPQMLLCVSIIAVNTTAVGQVSFRWHEAQLNLG